ncbi:MULTISPECIES: restriction endonuclease subunit S [Microcystis]|uniref:Restriction endonuclease subunit S n=1 Tax=Microcystis viridis FACHB-1342 TaxID=2692900 RepID=A0ABR8GD94_MICVR|nr:MULTISPECIES: restriction endonuclease subunit S [Microcystis]MBD2600973.1 restriction endonuclease subunit S [Microcystis viridis FACHB-1342]MCA2622907.1 restriction endonuclease subunit S [Microcystis sp. M19BS1]MCA2633066.1 restriction endonuclease subunit S [Microcystis sp. M20BS1]MDB9388823.1 restriction endonuclease subunit S [Microcystis aeruginosa CS-583]ODV38892.1 Type I restriction-modification system, specificity subunit S [Microcystis aeruginosa NIES-98]
MNRDLLSGEYKRFPKHWDVIPFTKAFKDMTGGQTKIPKGDYLERGDIPIIDQGQDLIGGYTNEYQAVCDIRLPCVLFGDHTKIFKFITKPFALGADGVKVLSEANNIDPKFAYYFLNTLNLPDVGYSRHFRFLKRTFFPLPPLEEQRRIAAILDKADGVRRKRKEAIRLTEELLRSTFLEMFGDPVTNPKGWEICEIGKITDVKTGKTPSREDEENYGGDIRWVKTTEVRELIIKETEEFLTKKGASQVSIFPKNTILIAMYGQGATRGRTALLGLPCATNQACAAIMPSEKYAPFYLWTLLRLSYERLRELGRGGNQPNLNLSMVKNFLIPMPPLEKQIYFQNIVLNLQSQRQKMDLNLQYHDNLFNSLLQKAFRGEL